MDIKELKDVAIELMDALKAKGLGEVEIELDDMKLKIKSAPPAPVVAAPAAAVAPAAAPAAASEDEAPAAAEDLPEGTPVRSPLVGTFYSSPSPDAPPFAGRPEGQGGRHAIHRGSDEDHERDQVPVRRNGRAHSGAARRYGRV